MYGSEVRMDGKLGEKGIIISLFDFEGAL